MLYYKILNIKNETEGFITLKDFCFYHPQRKKMFLTNELRKAQYVIFKGQYYTTDWLAESPELIGKYPKLMIDPATKEEYDEYMAEMAKVESEQK